MLSESDIARKVKSKFRLAELPSGKQLYAWRRKVLAWIRSKWDATPTNLNFGLEELELAAYEAAADSFDGVPERKESDISTTDLLSAWQDDRRQGERGR